MYNQSIEYCSSSDSKATQKFWANLLLPSDPTKVSPHPGGSQKTDAMTSSSLSRVWSSSSRLIWRDHPAHLHAACCRKEKFCWLAGWLLTAGGPADEVISRLFALAKPMVMDYLSFIPRVQTKERKEELAKSSEHLRT